MRRYWNTIKGWGEYTIHLSFLSFRGTAEGGKDDWQLSLFLTLTGIFSIQPDSLHSTVIYKKTRKTKNKNAHTCTHRPCWLSQGAWLRQHVVIGSPRYIVGFYANSRFWLTVWATPLKSQQNSSQIRHTRRVETETWHSQRLGWQMGIVPQGGITCTDKHVIVFHLFSIGHHCSNTSPFICPLLSVYMGR